MITKAVIDKEYVATLMSLARSSLPLESCALLFGRIEDNIAYVEGIKVLNNIANSNIMFAFDPDEFYKEYKNIRALGKDIICIFHSHPSKAEPSSMDLKYMSIASIPWLILSSIDYKFNLYIYDNRLKKLEIVIK